MSAIKILGDTPISISNSAETSLQAVREKALISTIYAAAAVATAAALIHTLALFINGTLQPILFDAGLVVALLILRLAKKINTKTRVKSLLVILFLAGVGFMATGSPSMSLGWIVACAALATLWLGVSSGLALTFAGSILLPVTGYLTSLEVFPWQQNSMQFNLTEQILLGASVLISLPVIIGLNTYIRGLERISDKTIQEHKNIEQKIAQQSEKNFSLDQRLVKLQTAAEISRIANTLLEPEILMEQVVQLICERFNLYYVGIYLVDEDDKFAVLKAGTGDAGQQMRNAGHRLDVGGTSMVAWAITHAQAQIAVINETETDHNKNPLLPLTRAELTLPLIYKQKVIGALTLLSEKTDAFYAEILDGLQGVAVSIAIAINNAYLFQSIQNKVNEIEALNRQYVVSAWTHELTDFVRLEHTYENPAQLEEKTEGQKVQAPLIIRNQVFGDLTLESAGEGWSSEEIQLIEAVAAQAAQALENARLIQETQKYAYQEKLIGEFSSRTRESLNIDTILRTAVRELGDRLDLAEVEAFIGWDETDKQI
jgi:GAF domain-containing protein